MRIPRKPWLMGVGIAIIVVGLLFTPRITWAQEGDLDSNGLGGENPSAASSVDELDNNKDTPDKPAAGEPGLSNGPEGASSPAGSLFDGGLDNNKDKPTAAKQVVFDGDGSSGPEGTQLMAPEFEVAKKASQNK